MSALTNILPAKYRQTVYAVLFLAGVALGALQAAYVTVGDQPQWLDVAWTVFGFLSGASHSVAGSNVHPPKPDPPAAG